MGDTEQIKAMMPDLINGKTHEQLEDEWETENIKRWGCHVWNGVRLPFLIPQTNLEALRSFEVRDDDVFIFSYPRSGSHWLNEIIHYILNDGKGDFDRTFMASMLEVTPNLDPTKTESTTPAYKINAAMKSPRCIASHCSEWFRPPQILTTNAKVVCVARNPKDVIVSVCKMMPTWTFDEIFWAFCHDKLMHGSWFDHVLEYWQQRGKKNFLFLKYEDLHKDLKGCICKLAELVEKDLADDVINGIIECVTFDGMKKSYQQVVNKYGEKGKEMITLFDIPHLRKGRVGDWKNFFTVTQNAIFDKIYAQRMEGTGLEFDFEI